MAETLTYSQIGTEDIRFGRSTFEVTLADGRAAVLKEHNLDDFDAIFKKDSSNTSTVVKALTLRTSSSGTPAAGLGTQLLFESESADENPAALGALQFTYDDISSGSEDSTFYILLRRAGAAISSAYAFRNTGNFQLLVTSALTAARTLTIPDATDTMVNLGSTQTLTAKTLTDPKVNGGGGSDTLIPGGMIDINVTSAATGANQTETDLITYSLPADSLNTTKDIIRVKAWGNTGANANTKTMRLKFGGLTLASNDITTAPNNKDWVLEGMIVRTGSDTQEATGQGHVAEIGQTYAHHTATETDSGAITIKVTGQNGTSNASDITAQGMSVEFLNGS